MKQNSNVIVDTSSAPPFIQQMVQDEQLSTMLCTQEELAGKFLFGQKTYPAKIQMKFF